MCTLKVRGTDPRLARFGKDWGVPPAVTVEDGRIISQPSGRALPKSDKPGVYGFNCAVSNRDWDDLPGQFSDAVAFLARHREALLELRDLKPEWAVLDFLAASDPTTRHVILFDVTIPVSLSRASAEVELAIEITLYFAPRPRESASLSADPGSSSPDAP